MASVMINGKQVHTTSGGDQAAFHRALESPIFRDFIDSIDPYFTVHKIDIQSVDLFGERVGFIKAKFDVTDPEDNRVPGIVFLRGATVLTLVILVCEGEEHAVMVQQDRFPSGKINFPGIPAGMVHEGKFIGTAAEELEEECGITISEDDLTDMTALVYNDEEKVLYVTPGGSDECAKLYLYTKEVSREELEEFQGKLTGRREEGERICLKVVPIANLVSESADFSVIVAERLYQECKTRNLLPT